MVGIILSALTRVKYCKYSYFTNVFSHYEIILLLHPEVLRIDQIACFLHIFLSHPFHIFIRLCYKPKISIGGVAQKVTIKANLLGTLKVTFSVNQCSHPILKVSRAYS